MRIIISIIILFLFSHLQAQNVGIGASPNPSAQLDVSSNTKGFLMPRMTRDQRNAIDSPAFGLMVFCTDCRVGGEIHYYDGIRWNRITGERLPYYQLGSDVDGESLGNLSGWSISLSSDGNRVAIGAPANMGINGGSSGHVRIYEWDTGAWVQIGNDIDGEAGGDNSGYSVSLSSDGTRVAVGAPYNDGIAAEAGHTRVFEWNGVAWTQLGNDIDGEANDDWSGYSVSLSSDGSRLAIGAPQNDGNSSNSGHVRVYEWNGSTWNQLGNDIDGEAVDDWSGYSVALSSDGSILAIGARLNDGNGTNSGHVRVYQWSGSLWNQLGNDIDGEAAEDYSGHSVSISSDGNRVAIGATSNNGNGTNSGHVRIYEWNGVAWTQLGNDIDGEAAFDLSGFSIALSSNGLQVAIGARLNDGSGIDAGHVRLFEWNGTSWVQLGNDIDGEAAGDDSGWSVSLSGDGTRIAIGGRYNDGTGNNSGHVRIFN